MGEDMPGQLNVSQKQIEQFLEKLVPEAKELVACLRLEKEGDGFKAWFRQALTNLHISHWAKLYEDPANEAKLAWLLLMKPDEINELNRRLKAMSPKEQSDWLRDFVDEMADEFADTEDVEPVTQEQLDAMTQAERDEFIADVQRFLAFFMPLMFNLFAKMVHGKSMYQLVAEAKAGNFQSALDAIQIDKTTVTSIPYFVDLNYRAADEGLSNVQRQINTYRNKPIFRGYIKYSTLWLVFAVLDDMQVLDQFEDDLEGFASLCQRLRIYGPPPEKDFVDLDAFQGRIDDYKKHRRHLIERSRQIVIVKDVNSPSSHP